MVTGEMSRLDRRPLYVNKMGPSARRQQEEKYENGYKSMRDATGTIERQT
jgi:hypothetical protein